MGLSGFTSFHRPYPPYDPRAWAFEQYLYQDMPESPVGDWTDLRAERENSKSPEAFVARYDRRTQQRTRAGYYGHMPTSTSSSAGCSTSCEA